ncbi:proline iminopeptidase [Klebsormidium nitens]|uniref:Proline iminopeptidase n=1 Tax=Klebsormidium nitens TaxID=105231 RepID=A0A1Y1IEG6_KLENI|nr:proline iminopeptidase [Klebsormidium nitens]|eukprot:GAQ87809.1 proline iminopeptidase [Klebsormidium nitens]
MFANIKLESWQQSWLRKGFLGVGLAAAGAAALIAGALKADAAECEPANQAEPQAEGGERRQLYPPTEPHTSGYLQVSDLHKIYWEECGNPDGQPVVFLHGGPGAGTAPVNRRFFDPEFYRIILVDQRGAGKSIPHASLVDNTTWHLVEDLEKLRKILKFDKWLVFGGSWGSTLSLAYAQTHPERVVGLVLRGIFMIRKHEINWFYQRGADHIFPDAWEPYRDFIPPDERSGLVAAYHRRLMNDKDPETQIAAARAWTAWEMSTAYLRPSQESKERGEDDKFALAFARIENHYFVNGGFFPSDSWLLDNVGKLRHIPAVIVQGRYDVVCPMTSAWDLHRAWPDAEFKVVPDAGHSANEAGIGAELVAATERFKRLYADGKAGKSS